jgi:ABC-type phosphate transport system substrate-binding protein
VLSQQGQETVVKDGYVPLPAEMAAKVLTDLAR